MGNKIPHNGILSSCGNRIYYRDGAIYIEGKYDDGYSDNVLIDPYEALSLRDWLIQESSTLEHMAQEMKK